MEPYWKTAKSGSKDTIDPLKIGCRVDIIDGKGSILRQNCGYLRYLGTTAFADGRWAGIELDGSTGKNDGSVNGRRYFRCISQRGIFVRERFVQQTETPGSPVGVTVSDVRNVMMFRRLSPAPLKAVTDVESVEKTTAPTEFQQPPPSLAQTPFPTPEPSHVLHDYSKCVSKWSNTFDDLFSKTGSPGVPTKPLSEAAAEQPAERAVNCEEDNKKRRLSLELNSYICPSFGTAEDDDELRSLISDWQSVHLTRLSAYGDPDTSMMHGVDGMLDRLMSSKKSLDNSTGSQSRSFSSKEKPDWQYSYRSPASPKQSARKHSTASATKKPGAGNKRRLQHSSSSDTIQASVPKVQTKDSPSQTYSQDLLKDPEFLNGLTTVTEFLKAIAEASQAAAASSQVARLTPDGPGSPDSLANSLVQSFPGRQGAPPRENAAVNKKGPTVKMRRVSRGPKGVVKVAQSVTPRSESTPKASHGVQKQTSAPETQRRSVQRNVINAQKSQGQRNARSYASTPQVHFAPSPRFKESGIGRRGPFTARNLTPPRPRLNKSQSSFDLETMQLSTITQKAEVLTELEHHLEHISPDEQSAHPRSQRTATRPLGKRDLRVGFVKNSQGKERLVVEESGLRNEIDAVSQLDRRHHPSEPRSRRHSTSTIEESIHSFSSTDVLSKVMDGSLGSKGIPDSLLTPTSSQRRIQAHKQRSRLLYRQKSSSQKKNYHRSPSLSDWSPSRAPSFSDRSPSPIRYRSRTPRGTDSSSTTFYTGAGSGCFGVDQVQRFIQRPGTERPIEFAESTGQPVTKGAVYPKARKTSFKPGKVTWHRIETKQSPTTAEPCKEDVSSPNSFKNTPSTDSEIKASQYLTAGLSSRHNKRCVARKLSASASPTNRSHDLGSQEHHEAEAPQPPPCLARALSDQSLMGNLSNALQMQTSQNTTSDRLGLDDSALTSSPVPSAPPHQVFPGNANKQESRNNSWKQKTSLKVQGKTNWMNFTQRNQKNPKAPHNAETLQPSQAQKKSVLKTPDNLNYLGKPTEAVGSHTHLRKECQSLISQITGELRCMKVKEKPNAPPSQPRSKSDRWKKASNSLLKEKSRWTRTREKKKKEVSNQVDALLSCIAVLDNANSMVKGSSLSTMSRRSSERRQQAVTLAHHKIRKQRKVQEPNLDEVFLKSKVLVTQESSRSIDSIQSGATAEELLKLTTKNLSPTIANATIKILRDEVDKKMPYFQQMEGRIRQGNSSTSIQESEGFSNGEKEQPDPVKQNNQFVPHPQMKLGSIGFQTSTSKPALAISSNENRTHQRKRSLEDSSTNDVINYFFELGKGV